MCTRWIQRVTPSPYLPHHLELYSVCPTGRGVGGAGEYLLIACRRHLTTDHASLSRRNTVPTPINNRDKSNIWALIYVSFNTLRINSSFFAVYVLAEVFARNSTLSWASLMFGTPVIGVLSCQSLMIGMPVFAIYHASH